MASAKSYLENRQNKFKCNPITVKGKLCVPGPDGISSFSHKYYLFVLARAELQLLS